VDQVVLAYPWDLAEVSVSASLFSFRGLGGCDVTAVPFPPFWLYPGRPDSRTYLVPFG